MQYVNSRKNDIHAQKLMKASKYAYKKEFGFNLLTVLFSAIFSIIGIVLSSYTFMLKGRINNTIGDTFALEKSAELISVLLKVNTLASGFFILIQVFLKWSAIEYHIEGVNFEERYENHVYGLVPNTLILKPIGEVVIEEYARKMTKIKRKKDEQTPYYEEVGKVELKQKELLENLYHLLRYARSKFFYLIWYGMIVVIVISSIIYGVNVSYLDVLLQILIPSLSILTMILQSMRNFHRTIGIVNNGLNSLNNVIKERELKNEELTNFDLRNAQDFIFSQRLTAPMIPFFVQRSFARYMKKQAQHAIVETSIVEPVLNSEPEQPFITLTTETIVLTESASITTTNVSSSVPTDVNMKRSGEVEYVKRVSELAEAFKAVNTGKTNKSFNDKTKNNEITKQIKTANVKKINPVSQSLKSSNEHTVVRKKIDSNTSKNKVSSLKDEKK